MMELFKFFVKDKFKNVIGIEPAKNLRYLNKLKKIDINTAFFNHKNSFFFKKNIKNLKLLLLIMSLHMFQI